MSYRNTPFNLIGYSFSDGKFTFNGVELPGIRAIDIKVEQEKNNKFGAGVYAVGRGRGVKDVTGSMDLDIETRNILQKAFAPVGDMTDVPPGVLVVTFDDDNGNIIRVNVTALEFKNDGVSTAQGDDEIVMTYDIVAGIIQILD